MEHDQKAMLKQTDDTDVSREHPRILHFQSGYELQTTETAEGGTLYLQTPEGKTCLKLIMTPEGPHIELEGVSLSLTAKQNLTLDCESLDIRAQKQLSLRSGGNIVQKAEGDISASAGNHLKMEAFSQELYARKGDMRIKANDDVMLDGERIRLNSPRTASTQNMKAVVEECLGKLTANFMADDSSTKKSAD